MTQELTSRARFAERAGVNASTVTRICKTIIKAGVSGKFIDLAHPCVVEYLAKRDAPKTVEPPAPAPGVDPLYAEAIKHLRASGLRSANAIKAALPIGAARARKIYDMIVLSGELDAPQPETFIPSEQPRRPDSKVVAMEKKKLAATDDEDTIIEIPENIQAFAEMPLRVIIERFGTDIRFNDWLKATQTIEAINEKRIKNSKSQGELVSRELVKRAIIEPIDTAHKKLLTDGVKTISRRVMAMVKADRPLVDIEKFVTDQVASFIKPVKAKVRKMIDDPD